MELVAKVDYHSLHGSLFVGDTTEGKDYPEEKKAQMLADFPEWFEVTGAVKKEPKTKEVEFVETPEDRMVVETPEAKQGKTRKK